MMRRHNISRAMAGARWNPRDGLIGSDQGLWLDPSDQNTIFSTSISSTPGVSVGSPVGKILDKSGNGHIVSTPDANRPILRQDSTGEYYLEFSGTQHLTVQSSTVTFKFMHSQKHLLSIAARFGTTGDPNAPYGVIGTSGTSLNAFGVSYFFDDRSSISRNNAIVYSVSTGSGTSGAVASAVLDNIAAPNTNLIVSAIVDPTNATAADRVAVYVSNGLALKTNTDFATAVTTNATYNLQIGACGNNTVPLKGRIYQIVIANKQVTIDQFERCKTFMARKAGVTW